MFEYSERNETSIHFLVFFISGCRSFDKEWCLAATVRWTQLRLNAQTRQELYMSGVIQSFRMMMFLLVKSSSVTLRCGRAVYWSVGSRGRADQRPPCFLFTRLPAQQSSTGGRDHPDSKKKQLSKLRLTKEPKYVSLSLLVCPRHSQDLGIYT